MVSGYTLTTFPNIIHATTTATRSKAKATANNKLKVVHIQRGIGTAQQHRVANTFLSPYVLSNTLSSSEGKAVSALYIL